jgi:hypothetical protein
VVLHENIGLGLRHGFALPCFAAGDFSLLGQPGCKTERAGVPLNDIGHVATCCVPTQELLPKGWYRVSTGGIGDDYSVFRCDISRAESDFRWYGDIPQALYGRILHPPCGGDY